MKKRRIRFVALIVMLTLVVNLFSTNIWAVENNTETSTVSPAISETTVKSSVDTEAAESTPTIVSEDISLRGMYEKHFLLSDGSYLATTYDEPIHYEDSGQWKEIDNTLTLRTDAKGIARYETVDGLADIGFAQQFQNKLVTMEYGGHTITWGVTAHRNLSNNETVSALTQQNASSASILTTDFSGISTEEQKTMAVKASSALRYSNALGQNVDLEYVVLSSRVKESIILNSSQNISSYTVNIETEGLNARLLENRQVEFYNKDGEVIFTMWAPYMYDAAGALSENIGVHLARGSAGQYILTMTPDANWISASNRVYPIVIDPDISNNHIQTNMMDNYVIQGAGVQNNNLDRVYFGNRSNGTARAFLKYGNMPVLPIDAIIVSATQTLTITSGTSTANSVNAYMVTGGDWSENTISWENMPAAGILLASNVGHNNLTKYVFDCTYAVEYWYCGDMTGQYQNYGMMIRYSDETINDYNAAYSSECATKSKRPSLSIRYHTESDIFWPAPDHYQINSKWGYRTFDSKVHRGIDIGCDGLTVIAAISGNVTVFNDPAAGRSLVITKPNSQFQVRYYHLKEGGYIVSSGYVEAGEPVAISGNTGISTGAHLHFQLQWGNDKYKSYNPLETYHRDDQRHSWENPNPLFVYNENLGIYVPNHNFNFEYEASDYNDTDESWAKG